MSRRSIVVISAGLSQPSSTRLLADQLAAATREAGYGLDLEVRPVELRVLGHDLVNQMTTGFPSPELREVIDAVVAADGLIAVSPIFNASYSGLFKSFFDALPEASLVDKPMVIAATGGSARHSLALEHALRPLFVFLRAVVMPTAVYAATEDWADPATGETLRARIRRAAGELVDQVRRRDPVAAAR